MQLMRMPENEMGVEQVGQGPLRSTPRAQRLLDRRRQIPVVRRHPRRGERDALGQPRQDRRHAAGNPPDPALRIRHAPGS